MYDDCTYEEVNAMRELNNEPFTLMTTLRKEDINCISEDAYYEMFLEPYFEKQLYEKYYDWDIWRKNEIYKIDSNNFLYHKKKSKKKYNKTKNYKDKIMKQFNVFNTDWLYGYPASFIRKYDNNGKVYFKRTTRGKRSSFLKHEYHIKMRKNKLYKYPKGNGCKKQFDFWWQYC